MSDVHRRCALVFVENAIPRARHNRTNGTSYRETCPNLALHELQQDVDLHRLLEDIRGLGRSADTAEERAVRDRVTAAELRPQSESTSRPGTVGFLRSASARGEEDPEEREWCGTNPQQQKNQASRGACGEHVLIVTVVTSSSSAGLLTRSAPCKTCRGLTVGETIGFGGLSEKALGRRVEERSASRHCCRGSSGGMRVLRSVSATTVAGR